jgi:phosphoglycerate dehydrogenase-like enzyme
MQQLDVNLVCPGHGAMAGKDLLEKQKRFFVELRQEVKKGVDAGLTAAEVARGIDLPWYKEWTSVKPPEGAVQHVYAEMTGTVAPWDLAEDFGVLEGPSPTKETAGWKAPRRIVVPSGLMPARLDELKRVAPEVEFLPAKNTEAAVRLAEGADAVIGFWSPEIAKSGKTLRWVHTDDEAVTGVQGNVVVTNSHGAYGPPLADHAFELLLPLLRRGENGAELHGKTIVIVGRGGSANPVARRATAFGMRVRLVDEKLAGKPNFAFSLERPAQLANALPTADVVVVCCPLTDSTRGLLGSKELALLKPSAFIIDVGRPGVLDLSALADAARANKLAGAGLDMPEPPSRSHALNGLDKVIITTQVTTSPEARERRWRLLRENVRRFTAGEPLLCVIER